jgi:hypothetical protein
VFHLQILGFSVNPKSSTPLLQHLILAGSTSKEQQIGHQLAGGYTLDLPKL